jgi:hypothetical protein
VGRGRKLPSYYLADVADAGDGAEAADKGAADAPGAGQGDLDLLGIIEPRDQPDLPSSGTRVGERRADLGERRGGIEEDLDAFGEMLHRLIQRFDPLRDTADGVALELCVDVQQERATGLELVAFGSQKFGKDRHLEHPRGVGELDECILGALARGPLFPP